MLHLAIEIALKLLTFSGITFYLLALWSAYRFRRQGKAHAPGIAVSGVSILKPLYGADAETYAALRSHCVQDYEHYEVIFGVNSLHDEAVPLVRRLIAEFPDRNIRLVVCAEVLGSNRKVSNLIILLREAQYQHVLVNDGDIRVSAGYLREIMVFFKDPHVGMVTCLYKGKPAQTISSRLESLGIATDFAPGVLTACFLDKGLRFGLGSTLAMSRIALEKIGGFESVADYLADDFELGRRIADAGFRIALAHEVVETAIPPYSFSQFWQHQLRWARTMRISRPAGYRGLVLTFGLPWAILLISIAPYSRASWALLLLALLARSMVAFQVGVRILGDGHLLHDLWLLPFRDLVALATWFCSYAGNTVRWGDTEFRLENGRMYAISTERTEVAITPGTEDSR